MPYEFEYPKEFLKLIELGLLDFEVWGIIDATDAVIRLEGLKKRYPEYKLIPFARCWSNDDIACFEVGKNNSVIVIHDYSDNAYKNRKEYETFLSWFEEVIKEMIQEFIWFGFELDSLD